MRAAALCLLVASCAAPSFGPAVHRYEVLVGDEEICRTFGGQPESCALTNTPEISATITVEDHGDGTATIYGRADTVGQRVYQAKVPRSNRYEVDDRTTQTNANTGCINQTEFILVLDVDDRGLDGAEQSTSDENRRCNAFNERRVTVRKRNWTGSRL